jgi:hypothetical protein
VKSPASSASPIPSSHAAVRLGITLLAVGVLLLGAAILALALR